VQDLLMCRLRPTLYKILQCINLNIVVRLRGLEDLINIDFLSLSPPPLSLFFYIICYYLIIFNVKSRTKVLKNSIVFTIINF